MTRQSEITAEGLKKLEEDIEYMSTVRRREVSERIREARDFGDISENAEYDDAKNEQAQLEGQIANLEERLRRSTVVDEIGTSKDAVGFGSIVHIKDQGSGESRKLQIVGSTEANLSEGLLSSESPIGTALIGGKKGQIVKIASPRGPEKEFKITKIETA